MTASKFAALCPRPARVRPATPRTRHAPLLPLAFLVALLLSALLAPAVAFAQAAPHPLPGANAPAATDAKGRVTGRIEAVPEGTSAAGAKVVLMRYTLNAEGVPEGKELGTRTTDASGRYVFEDVPITARSLYRVLVDLGDKKFGSQGFPMTAENPTVEANAPYPHLSGDTSQLRIDEALLAVEPSRGRVLVTQVAHLVNSGSNIVDGSAKPVEMRVPADAEGLEVVREIDPAKGHERQGQRVLLFGNLPPGRTTVAVRYRLSALLGTVDLEAQFPYDVGVFSVLVPEGTATITGPGLSPQASQTIQNTRYDIWAATRIAANTPLPVEVNGVPVRQQVLLIPLGFFAVIMVGVVWWFMRRRLPTESEG